MTKLQANLCLLCVTLCWSTEVIIFACIPADVTPFATTCITSLIGAVLLFFLFFSRVAAAMREHGREILTRSLFLGALNCTYNILYQYGLDDFDVSTGAFTLALTAVILPFVLLARKNGVDKRTWIAAALVLIGTLAALSSTFSMDQLGGLALIALGCLIRAVYIIKISDYAKQYDPISLSAIMALTVGIITFIPWTITQPATFAAIHWSRTAIASLAIYAYFLVVFAQTVNFFAQKRSTPSNATIIYSMEIVFSVFWGAVLPGYLIDRVAPTPAIIVGLLFVVAGNLVEVISPSSPEEKEITAEPEKKITPVRIGLGKSRMAVVLNLSVGYLLIAVPFKVLSVIPGFTDIRPVTMLGPIYAIFCGIPGCVIYALGNLVMDAFSDSLRWSSSAGLIASFAGPFLVYLFWTKFSSVPFSLRSVRQITKHIGIVIVAAVLSAAIITPVIALLYPDVNAFTFARTVLLNETAFPVFFGIALMIIMQEELRMKTRP